jgi:dipeptidyl aminopeptidase/acylaminoacyl peptidase
MTIRRSATIDAATAAATTPAAAATRRPMTEDDVLALVWIADPRISPDGTRIAFTRVEVDVKEDKYTTSLWLVGVDGGEARALTADRVIRSHAGRPTARRSRS